MHPEVVSVEFCPVLREVVLEQPPREKVEAVPVTRASSHPICPESDRDPQHGRQAHFFLGMEKGAVCIGEGRLGLVCTRINWMFLSLDAYLFFSC